jgi:hypothetical protein
MTVSYQVNGGGSGYSAPVFNYVQGGINEHLTLTNTPTMVNVDAGSAWSVTNPLLGSTSNERWWVPTASGIASIPQTISFSYQNQYDLVINSNPSSAGTLTPPTGWQNASAVVSIQATANSNYAFLSWTGVGAGSFTGTSNPVTATMNGPITETANFQQTGGQLSVNLVSPKNGTSLTGSHVTLKVSVANSIQGATVTVTLDGKQVCTGSTGSNGAFSCSATVTKTGGTHSWFATASKTGFTPGTSPTWTLKY